MIRKLAQNHAGKNEYRAVREMLEPLADTFSKRGARFSRADDPVLAKMGHEFNRFINEGSCNFYRAPAAIILCLDNAFSKARLVDVGIAVGYFVLVIRVLS